MSYQGIAHLRFDETHEIINLAPGGRTQAHVAASFTPAIGLPSTDTAEQPDVCGELYDALCEGGHYINVSPMSDLPVVGIIDQKWISDWTFAKNLSNHIVWVGYMPVLIQEPMEHPLLLPPLARHYWGHRNPIDLYPLCGIGEAGISPSTGYTAFYISLKYGITPQSKDMKNDSQIYRYRLLPDITGPAVVDGVSRYVSFATIIFGQDLFSSGSYGTAANPGANCSWAFYKAYQGITTSPNVAITLLSNKAVAIALAVGNKIFPLLRVQDDNANQVTINSDSTIELQTGGYYE